MIFWTHLIRERSSKSPCTRESFCWDICWRRWSLMKIIWQTLAAHCSDWASIETTHYTNQRTRIMEIRCIFRALVNFIISGRTWSKTSQSGNNESISPIPCTRSHFRIWLPRGMKIISKMIDQGANLHLTVRIARARMAKRKATWKQEWIKKRRKRRKRKRKRRRKNGNNWESSIHRIIRRLRTRRRSAATSRNAQSSDKDKQFVFIISTNLIPSNM